MAKGIEIASEKQDTDREARGRNREAMGVRLIEESLRKLAHSCAENELPFQARQYGVKYCCLFMQGSSYRYICPYVEEDTVHICEKGMDTMRYKCGYHR